MGSGKEETEWNVLLAFICSKAQPVCAVWICQMILSQRPFFFCRDSIWVMLIQAGVWDLWGAIWFESNKEPLWNLAQNINEACSMLTRWGSLSNSFNLSQAPLCFQVFIWLTSQNILGEALAATFAAHQIRFVPRSRRAAARLLLWLGQGHQAGASRPDPKCKCKNPGCVNQMPHHLACISPHRSS